MRLAAFPNEHRCHGWSGSRAEPCPSEWAKSMDGKVHPGVSVVPMVEPSPPKDVPEASAQNQVAITMAAVPGRSSTNDQNGYPIPRLKLKRVR